MFSYNMIPTINITTRVTRNTATLLIISAQIQLYILNSKVELSKQIYRIIFPIIFALKTIENMIDKQREHFVCKIYYEEQSTSLFKQKLHKTTWDDIKNIKESNEAHRKFLETFSCIYESAFPKKRKRKNL